MSDYLDITNQVYKEAALEPQEGLCCTTTPVWDLPGLDIPLQMQKMNYGCGSTVHPRDLVGDPKVLYVGVGGGMELLQFAYFCRSEGSVIGIDTVDEMLSACAENLDLASNTNEWFNPNFVSLRNGSALDLPIENKSVDVAAQNCLFNVFKQQDLKLALREMYRVLKPGGRLVLSDPVSDSHMPESLRADHRLRAMCLSGAISLQSYIEMITDTGFGTVEIRARRPYRILDPEHYDTPEMIFLESVEVCAIKDDMPEDGPCVFTGRTAIYFGNETHFDDGKGHTLFPNAPASVCDKTANALLALGRPDLYVSDSTFFYDGGGCC